MLLKPLGQGAFTYGSWMLQGAFIHGSWMLLKPTGAFFHKNLSTGHF